MWGNFRRQAAQGCGDEIRRDHDGKKGAGDFAAWMARTRQEVLNEQRDHEEEGKNDPADPPGNRRPAHLYPGLLPKLKNEQRDHEEEGKNDPADPPGNRRPAYMYRGLLLKLKKEQAGRGEDGAGEKESCAEDQGDAVLRALEADQRDGGEHKSQQTASP